MRFPGFPSRRKPYLHYRDFICRFASESPLDDRLPYHLVDGSFWQIPRVKCNEDSQSIVRYIYILREVRTYDGESGTVFIRGINRISKIYIKLQSLRAQLQAVITAKQHAHASFRQVCFPSSLPERSTNLCPSYSDGQNDINSRLSRQNNESDREGVVYVPVGRHCS